MVEATRSQDDRSGGGGRGAGGDWNDESYIAGWLDRQRARAAERRRQFALVRAFVPKRPDEAFSYLNLGAGPGNLDEVLLEHFAGATAKLVDFSFPMLAAARERLERFGNRVEYVQANLERPEWVRAIGGSFDCVVSTLAIHHLEDPRRVRAIYGEIHSLLGHGGVFLNLDRVRPARPVFEPLAAWAAQDVEARLAGGGHSRNLPGTLIEHLGWLGEAGFGGVDVLWKELGNALLCAVRDHVHVPDVAGSPDYDGAHHHDGPHGERSGDHA